MVSCKIWAGLGNQMFQVAATVAHALRYKEEWDIPSKTIDSRIWKNHFAHLSRGLTMHQPRIWDEPDFSYREIPYQSGRDLLLQGYFQSELYFSDYRKEVLEILGFNYSESIWKECCSIHVRLGDYRLYPDKHPIISFEYIDAAMKEMQNRGYEKFILFSDEPKAASNIVKSVYRGKGLMTMPDADPFEHMKMMAQCGSNIIANSTFSWWGAYANENPSKTVIAPSVWFGKGNSHLNTKDLIPKSWKII